MLRSISGLFLVLLLAILLTSCSDQQGLPIGDDTSVAPIANWKVGIVNEDLVVISEDGKMTKGIEGYQGLVADNIAGTEEVNITFNPQSVVEAQDAKMADTFLKGFGYQIRLSAETGYLGGCIGKVVPHVGVAISKLYQSGTLANLHIAIWRNNGRVCGAVLASVNNNNGFCWSTCSPTMKDIQNGVKNGLLYVGIPYLLAEAMATIIAPVAVALSPVGL